MYNCIPNYKDIITSTSMRITCCVSPTFMCRCSREVWPNKPLSYTRKGFGYRAVSCVDVGSRLPHSDRGLALSLPGQGTLCPVRLLFIQSTKRHQVIGKETGASINILASLVVYSLLLSHFPSFPCQATTYLYNIQLTLSLRF